MRAAIRSVIFVKIPKMPSGCNPAEGGGGVTRAYAFTDSYSKIPLGARYPNSSVIKLDAYGGEHGAGIGAESKFERARTPRSLSRIYSRRLGPVVETRFSFLLTAAAVTPSKRMQFHPSAAQLFAYERKIRDVVARDPLARPPRCCRKSAN